MSAGARLATLVAAILLASAPGGAAMAITAQPPLPPLPSPPVPVPVPSPPLPVPVPSLPVPLPPLPPLL
ncbi:MAG: hypothetical protein L0Y54_12815 [Sporichthyaceae bacterium]|nr:hypothetical protein [Sporichthyaceae bacterium]